GYYPAQAPSGTLVRALLEGEATSEVGMKAGLTRDVWTAIQPDPDRLNKVVDALDARVRGRPLAEQAQAVGRLLALYRAGGFPAQFRLIASPLVTWIWLGALVVFAGGLIALWPAPDAARGRVRGRLAARVAQELGRV
ncbi:MAG TPA: heme lyase CcmF/NrfE family subunit, partial [Solirubrobacteraceae bacterium]|nr:heme lyase CcmF/NrfE family subunit [Solirubrobacteraceae bacterium]